MAALDSRDIQTEFSQRDWLCEDADTRYLTHSVHRYSGKFIPQIAKHAIELVSEPGELILDPFCGSGTTLLEALLASRRAIGIDMNPLATLISRVKTTPIPTPSIQSLVSRFASLVDDLPEKDEQLTLFTELDKELRLQAEADFRWSDDWYRKWFGDDVLRQLILIWSGICDEADERCQRLAQVAFSDTLRRVSMAASGYPNVMYDKRRPERPLPGRLFLKRLESIAESVSGLERAGVDASLVEVVDGDAKATKFEDNSIDAIVTHPPYIGSVPYAEYGVLSLTWLGYDAKALDRRLAGGKRQSRDVVQRFEQDYEGMLSESHRILKPGRHVFLLVGHPKVKGTVIDLGEMTERLAKFVGFEMIASWTRQGMNRRSNQMGDENLICLTKPI